MYDYKYLDAMATVIKAGSFESAARKLFITQSAVSQRIKHLEELVGRPVLIRSSPPTATDVGLKLLAHHRKVVLLEAELNDQLNESTSDFVHISVAINRDSLALWFMEAMGSFIKDQGIIVEIFAEDQELTHQFLKEGRVFGCVSSRKSPLQGCKAEYIGTMTFYLSASPEFYQRWFPRGVGKQALLRAPAVCFDEKDHMLQDFLSQKFKVNLDSPPVHTVPVVTEFQRFVTDGFGYGLLAVEQIADGFDTGRLINLVPNKPLEIDLYWHSWQLQTDLGNQFSQALLTNGKKVLSLVNSA